MAQVVQYLPSDLKFLGLISNTTKKYIGRSCIHTQEAVHTSVCVQEVTFLNHLLVVIYSFFP
jgi:hypothetical protein